MLQICAKFAETLTFNCKKSMCIKFGDNVNANEIIKLNDSQIPWVKEIKHLGNYVNKTLSDKSDFNKAVLKFNFHYIDHKHGRLILTYIQ